MTHLKILIIFLYGIYNIETLDNSEYVLNFNSPVYMCSDSDSEAFIEISDIEVQRYNETTVFMSGFLKYLKGLNRHTMLDLKIEKETSGRYELTGSHEICDFCKEIELGTSSNYYKYIKYFEFPDKCPFDANKYFINKFVIDTEDFPLNEQNAGQYQATINYYETAEGDCRRNKKFIGCVKVDVIIEPL